jgi:hypothetical protein
MRTRGTVPNRGGGPRRRRPALGNAVYVLEGPLRFVDRHGACAALRVEDGNAAGRRFVGRTVTLDLSAARVDAADRDDDGTVSYADLVAGERVVAVLRLPRGLAEPPELLAVSRLTACRAAVGP